MKDGWHKINGYTVYIEDNKVVRGVTDNRTTYPYKYMIGLGWSQMKINPRSLYKANYEMF